MIHFLQSIDGSLLDYLYSIRSLPVSNFFIGVTELGEYTIVLGLMLALALWLGLQRRFADIAGLLAAVGGSTVVVLLLKYLVHRPRPAISYQAYLEGPYYSFPSAHTALAMAFYGFCTYLLIQTYPTIARRIAVVLLPILIALIGFSRLYLGVHYLSDVIAGALIGAFFIWIGSEVRIRYLVKEDSRRE